MFVFTVTSSSPYISKFSFVKGLYVVPGRDRKDLIEATCIFNKLFCNQLDENHVRYSDISVEGDSKYVYTCLIYKVYLKYGITLKFEVTCSLVRYGSMSKTVVGKLDDGPDCWAIKDLERINSDIKAHVSNKLKDSEQTRDDFKYDVFEEAIGRHLINSVYGTALGDMMLDHRVSNKPPKAEEDAQNDRHAQIVANSITNGVFGNCPGCTEADMKKIKGLALNYTRCMEDPLFYIS